MHGLYRHVLHFNDIVTELQYDLIVTDTESAVTRRAGSHGQREHLGRWGEEGGERGGGRGAS